MKTLREDKLMEWAQELDRLNEEYERIKSKGFLGRKGNPNIYSSWLTETEPRYPQDSGDLIQISEAKHEGIGRLINEVMDGDYGLKIDKILREYTEDIETESISKDALIIESVGVSTWNTSMENWLTTYTNIEANA